VAHGELDVGALGEKFLQQAIDAAALAALEVGEDDNLKRGADGALGIATGEGAW
jgi:hypothetical protein